jgi:hypothetical protein
MHDIAFSGGLSVQDADLLARINAYCDRLEQRLEQGQGWLIFNSSQDRGARILRLLLTRLEEYRALINLCHLPWRDFALHAYIRTVELPEAGAQTDDAAPPTPLQRERDLATTITNAVEVQLKYADLLILSNLHPTKLHETIVLSQTAMERANRHRAIIALTDHDPWSLSTAFAQADPTGTTWQHFYTAMRDSSYIAH